jgi:hypothetical protein
MSIFNMLHDGAEGSDRDENVNSMSTKQFLGIEPGRSYSTPPIWLKYGRSLRPNEVKQLDALIRCQKEGLRVSRYSVEQEDRGGRPYTWVEFAKAKGNVSAKLILEAGMAEFFNDYLDGKVTIDFTLAELIEEAKKH